MQSVPMKAVQGEVPPQGVRYTLFNVQCSMLNIKQCKNNDSVTACYRFLEHCSNIKWWHVVRNTVCASTSQESTAFEASPSNKSRSKRQPICNWYVQGHFRTVALWHWWVRGKRTINTCNVYQTYHGGIVLKRTFWSSLWATCGQCR